MVMVDRSEGREALSVVHINVPRATKALPRMLLASTTVMFQAEHDH
jgi:hypothetical protein